MKNQLKAIKQIVLTVFSLVLLVMTVACQPYQTTNRATFPYVEEMAEDTAGRLVLPSLDGSDDSMSSRTTEVELIRPESSPYTLYALPAKYTKNRPHTVDVGSLPSAYVERVVDGDTLIVHMDGERDRLRMLAIDAPESSSNPDLSRQTKEGDVVSALVGELLTDSTVWLEFDQAPRDQYGRLLAYVWLDASTMINENLVFSGLVDVVRFPPNTAYYDYFLLLKNEARSKGLGFYNEIWP